MPTMGNLAEKLVHLRRRMSDETSIRRFVNLLEEYRKILLEVSDPKQRLIEHELAMQIVRAKGHGDKIEQEIQQRASAKPNWLKALMGMRGNGSSLH